MLPLPSTRRHGHRSGFGGAVMSKKCSGKEKPGRSRVGMTPVLELVSAHSRGVNSGLVACREGPRGLWAQRGLRRRRSSLLGRRGRLGRGRLLCSSLLCSRLLRSSLLRRGLLYCSLFGSCLFGSSLLGWSGLLYCSLFGWSCLLDCSLLGWSLLHCSLFSWSCLFDSGLLGWSFLHCSLFSGRSLLHSGFLSRGSLLRCHFFRSCHTDLLDQVAKSTALRTAVQGSITHRPLGSERGVMNGVSRVDISGFDPCALCGS
jgi:hypothetical protein